MNATIRRAAFGVVLALGFGMGAAPAHAQDGAGQKKAEDVYKNIKVLKGLPSDQLIPTMQFFAASLGVGCDFCHVEPRDKDDKKQKETARKMIQMVSAVNKDDFEGKRRVTCNTCHRGSTGPRGTPQVAAANFKPWDPDSPNGLDAEKVPGPPADELIENYLKSLGGMAALQKISTRVVKGTATDSTGRSLGLELISRGPDDGISITHLGNGDNVTVHTGGSGWFRAGKGPPRDIRLYELDDLRMQDPLYLATHLKQILSDPETRLARMDNREVYQLRAMAWGRMPVRLFFGKSTGTLLRIIYFTETAVGQNPTRIDYNEYREVNDVSFPFRWTIAKPLGYQTFRIDQMQQNVPVDEAKFAKPPVPASAERR